MKTVVYLIAGFIVAFVGLIVVLIAIGFWMADPWNLKAPSDKKLIANFQNHHTQFEEIQHMATEDLQRGLYLRAPFFDDGSKFDKPRQQEYEKLIAQIHPDIHVAADRCGMCFGFSGGGLLAIGPEWEKGIEYVPASYETNGAVYCRFNINGVTYHQWAGNILTNLNNARTLPAIVYLREIEPNWFLFYSRDDG